MFLYFQDRLKKLPCRNTIDFTMAKNSDGSPAMNNARIARKPDNRVVSIQQLTDLLTIQPIFEYIAYAMQSETYTWTVSMLPRYVADVLENQLKFAGKYTRFNWPATGDLNI